MPTLPNDELRATPLGTTSFANRHAGVDFRKTTFDLRVSSLGIGTYLGESTDADDAAYVKSVRHPVDAAPALLVTVTSPWNPPDHDEVIL